MNDDQRRDRDSTPGRDDASIFIIVACAGLWPVVPPVLYWYALVSSIGSLSSFGGTGDAPPASEIASWLAAVTFVGLPAIAFLTALVSSRRWAAWITGAMLAVSLGVAGWQSGVLKPSGPSFQSCPQVCPPPGEASPPCC